VDLSTEQYVTTTAYFAEMLFTGHWTLK